VFRADRHVAKRVVRAVHWNIVPLVAGLLVIVSALEAAGVARFANLALNAAATLSPWLGREVVGLLTAGVANVANNLPVAAFAARVLSDAQNQLAHAVRDPNGRAYNRTAHFAERRKMMQAWADYLDKLKNGADVIPILKAG